MTPLPRAFFDRPALTLARALLGALVVSELGGARTVGRIVETEAYRSDDPASHSFRGPRPSNATMFGPPGHAYVYRSHGIHRCMNAVARAGSAVLLRALEPVEGLGAMAARRGLDDERLLCAGPGRLCQALGIHLEDDGFDLTRGAGLWLAEGIPPRRVARTPRIGISAALDKAWRFVDAETRFASRPVRSGRAKVPATRRAGRG